MSSSSNFNLVNWTNDQLIDCIGFTDNTLIEFIIELGKKAPNPQSLLVQFQKNDVPINDRSKRFATELYRFLHPPTTSSSSITKNSINSNGSSSSTQPTHASLLRESAKYKLVPDVPILSSSSSSSSISSSSKIKPTSTTTSSISSQPTSTLSNTSQSVRSSSSLTGYMSDHPSKKKHLRRRRNDEESEEDNDDDDNDDNDDGIEDEREVQKFSSSSSSAPTTNELKRSRTDQTGTNDFLPPPETPEERDQRERKEFEKRLLDRENTQKSSKRGSNQHPQHPSSSSSTVIADDTNNPLSSSSTVDDTSSSTVTSLSLHKSENIENIRKQSRRDYLQRREARELDLLAEEVRIDEEIIGIQNLSREEKKKYEMNKQLLELARTNQANTATVLNETPRYHMPGNSTGPEETTVHEKRETLLHNKSLASVTTGKSDTKHEQLLWEEQQLAGTTVHYGAADKKKTGNDYDFVFDDAVDFLESSVLTGTVENTTNDDSSSRTLSSVSANNTAELTSVVNTKPRLTEREQMATIRRSLPIFTYRDDLLQAIADYQVLVVVGETGSGKTTQIPQYLHEAGYTKLGKVGCTQPRRVAAMSVAARVATEMGVKLGNEVGYSIRFEDCTSPKTIIKYMTDGMLLREFLMEPDLASYSVMIIDEAHERTLHTDILLGLIKDIVRYRQDLKVIISSATVDAEKFAAYFDDAPIYNIPGRRYPVTYYYTANPEQDYVQAAIVTVLQVHVTQDVPGDILVFLTGQDEIETAAEELTKRTRGLGTKIKELIICPIYSTLPVEQQTKIFVPTPPNARKVVIATNIAETSLTIDGIVYVIDCGYGKQNVFNARTGMESLQVTPISKASAVQRAGRAGRTGPGKCFRLYTSWAYENELPNETTPEILRVNLANVVLMLKSLGIEDLVHFDFMDPPPNEALLRALEQLYALGALNDRGQLTKLGRKMAEFPCDPTLSKMIIMSEKYHCTDDIITIAAMLDVNNSIFYRPKDKALIADTIRQSFSRGMRGDHTTILNVFNTWRDSGYSTQWCFENFIQAKSMKRARDIREQLANLCERVEIPVLTEEKFNNSSSASSSFETSNYSTEYHDAIAKAITSGFFYNIAKLTKGGTYRTVKLGHNVRIHPSSSVAKDEIPPRWIVYHELVKTSDEFVRVVSSIQSTWLLEIAPHYYKAKDIIDEATSQSQKHLYTTNTEE